MKKLDKIEIFLTVLVFVAAISVSIIKAKTNNMVNKNEVVCGNEVIKVKSKVKYYLVTDYYVPDSLVEEHRKWVLDAIGKSNNYIKNDDKGYKSIQMINSVAEGLYKSRHLVLCKSIRVRGQTTYVYIRPDKMSTNEKIIYNKLMKIN